MSDNKEIKDNELDNANGGIKIVVDYGKNKLLENSKNIVEKLENKFKQK